jgi:hypothetical protein
MNLARQIRNPKSETNSNGGNEQRGKTKPENLRSLLKLPWIVVRILQVELRGDVLLLRSLLLRSLKPARWQPTNKITDHRQRALAANPASDKPALPDAATRGGGSCASIC